MFTRSSFRRLGYAALGAAAISLSAPSLALAAPVLGFTNITGNDVADAAAGEAQLSVELFDLGSGEVLFQFGNTGPDAMSITDVYFDDGALLGIARLIDADENGGDSGVDFSEGASPPDLPGGNAIDFNTTAGFLADADTPNVTAKGVNPGETLGVVFDLQAGLAFQDVLDALELSRNNPGQDVQGGLRIGIHVQGFDGGGSESFVNNGTNVPVPATAALVGAGLLGLGLLTRRRRTA